MAISKKGHFEANQGYFAKIQGWKESFRNGMTEKLSKKGHMGFYLKVSDLVDSDFGTFGALTYQTDLDYRIIGWIRTRLF